MIYLPPRFFLWTIPFEFDKMESAYNGGLIYGSVRTTNQKIQEQKGYTQEKLGQPVGVTTQADQKGTALVNI